MSTVELVVAQIEHADELADVGRRTFVETFGHLYSAADLQTFLHQVYARSSVAAELADPAYAVCLARRDGRCVGYVKVGRCCEAVRAWIAEQPVLAMRKSLELRQLYVERDEQGRGVAQQLMNWGLDWLYVRTPDDIYLSVFSENLRAQRFYARYGFTHVAEYNFMVGEHADREFIFRVTVRATQSSASLDDGNP